jgi:hypothetical protein
LSNWNFCKDGSGCKKGNKEEIGKYVDFTITVNNKGKPARKGKKEKKQRGKKHKAPKVFFGESNSISFPSTVSTIRYNFMHAPIFQKSKTCLVHCACCIYGE